ncbi:MAG: hypothetical protein WBD55_01235 [Dehalococcoidia bacterium]
MKATRAFVTTLLALAAIGVAAWFGWSAFGPESTEGAQSRLRFGNISIVQPAEDSGLFAGATYAPPESVEKPGGGPVIVVTDESEAGSGMMIDANSGEVLVDTIGSALRAEADDIIASIRQVDEPPGVWPLADVDAPGPRVAYGNISYIEPDPSSGIFVLRGQGNGPFLFVHNGSSRMTIDGNSGKVEVNLVLAKDREAFDRLAATVRAAPKR